MVKRLHGVSIDHVQRTLRGSERRRFGSLHAIDDGHAAGFASQFHRQVACGLVGNGAVDLQTVAGKHCRQVLVKSNRVA